MSVIKKEEIEAWNSHFKNGEIQESDLKRPTEIFLVRALVSFLKKLGYKVDPPFPLNVKTLDPIHETFEKRQFLIRIAHNIDRMLKYTNKTYTCYYYDLIHPMPKKTSHILGILLNYYVYSKMFAEEGFNIANERIKKRADLIKDIEKNRRINKELSQYALQLEDEMTKLQVALPNTKAEIEECVSKIKDITEQLQHTKQEVKQYTQNYFDLQTYELKLKMQIVHDDEAEALKSDLESLQKQIKSHDALLRNVQGAFKERLELNSHLNRLLKFFEEADALTLADQIQEYKDTMKKLKDIELESAQLNQDVKTLMNSITNMSNDLESLTEKLKSNKQNLEQAARVQLAEITEKQRRNIQYKNNLNLLKVKLQDLNIMLSEQEEIHEVMLKSIAKIMAYYVEENFLN